MGAPTGVPPEIINKLSDTMAKALTEPETREKLAAIGAIPVGGTAGELGAFLRGENVKWTKAVKDSNIRLD